MANCTERAKDNRRELIVTVGIISGLTLLIGLVIVAPVTLLNVAGVVVVIALLIVGGYVVLYGIGLLVEVIVDRSHLFCLLGIHKETNHVHDRDGKSIWVDCETCGAHYKRAISDGDW